MIPQNRYFARSGNPYINIIHSLSSSRITVVCLFLLFILTFWGTIAQVEQGLYGAQERFFNSFFFLAAGFIPFPGAQLVLWLLFVNLICMIFLSWKKYTQWAHIGLLITHLGLLLYFFAAFMVFHVSRESSVRLGEGQSTNVSVSDRDWELAYWTDNTQNRQVTAVDAKDFKHGFLVPFRNKDFFMRVSQYYPNSDVVNGLLTPKPLWKEREQNIVGGEFDLYFDSKAQALILFGAESQATPVSIAGKTYYFILRHKSYPLPFTIRLDHFKAEFHPGTDMAKNFESSVTVWAGPLERQARIFMNQPLRYKDYTLYQASYDTDNRGHQYSTLAVVENFARVLPYMACLVVFFGLALHFLIQAFISKRDH
ncbi:MAG: cytochrome c biogenesis protein ResB [Candidatus Omnitrophica bacterium]|nr:cytochrome c biogenesis protein ResB [Candidatus Omnitrophota bacterium]